MKNWRNTALCGALAIVVSAGLAPLAATYAADVKTIDVLRGKTMKEQGAVFLDVREPHEYAQSHVPGSILVPLGELKTRLQEIRSLGKKPVAIICRSGRRSAIAAEILEQAGFANVYNVQGGMLAWEAAALPIVQGRK